MIIATLEELQEKVGQPLGTSTWHTIGQDTIDAFARVTGDDQWIHVDSRRAATGPFGTTIAHGYLTLSLCSRFLDECLTVRGVRTAINYGVNRGASPRPCRPARACAGTPSWSPSTTWRAEPRR